MGGTFANATNKENVLASRTSRSIGVTWKTERIANTKGKLFEAFHVDFYFMVTLMELDPSELQFDPSCSLNKVGLSGLLLSRDLIFITKIKGTAASLGHSMLVAGTQSQAISMITTYRPPVVLVDLTAGEMAASTALKTYKELAGAECTL